MSEGDREHLRRLHYHVRVIEARQAARRGTLPASTTETHERESKQE